jgi:hypothetical protein
VDKEKIEQAWVKAGSRRPAQGLLAVAGSIIRKDSDLPDFSARLFGEGRPWGHWKTELCGAGNWRLRIIISGLKTGAWAGLLPMTFCPTFFHREESGHAALIPTHCGGRPTSLGYSCLPRSVISSSLCTVSGERVSRVLNLGVQHDT